MKNKEKINFNPISYIITIIQGFIIGIANVIPGLSGGTLALIMGIYAKFIGAFSDISSFLVALLKFLVCFNKEKKLCKKDKFIEITKEINWLWIIAIFVGAFIAVLIMSGVISILLLKFPAQVYGLFFGLILASVIVPWGKMEKKGIPEFIAIIIGFILLFIYSGLKLQPSTNSDGGQAIWYLFIAGAISSSAMILPGLSGSFILVLLGVYGYILELFSSLAKLMLSLDIIIPIIIFGMGMVIGLLAFSRALNFLLKKYNSITMGFLIGLMLGSLRAIYPFLDIALRTKGMDADEIPKLIFWNMPEYLPLTTYIRSLEFLSIVIFIIIGILIVFITHYISSKKLIKKQS